MTDEEKKEIVAEVIQTLKTNAVTVDQLNEVLAYTDDDYVELNKGRKMKVKKIEENIASGIDNKYGVTIQNLETKDDEIEAYSKKITTEYNVSTFHPTSGPNGDNKYTLETAIAQVPAELRTAGLKVSFLNSAGKPESWKYQGGSWAVANFIKEADGGNKILEWVTDAATTRKQVSANERKAGMQISYKPDGEDWVNEQYVGTSFTDTEWAKDSNWEASVKQEQIDTLSNQLLEEVDKIQEGSSQDFEKIDVGNFKDNTTLLNGLEYTLNGRSVSDFFNVEEYRGKILEAIFALTAADYSSACAFYDANESLLSYIPSKGLTKYTKFKIPENAVLMRVSCKTDDKEDFSLFIDSSKTFGTKYIRTLYNSLNSIPSSTKSVIGGVAKSSSNFGILEWGIVIPNKHFVKLRINVPTKRNVTIGFMVLNKNLQRYFPYESITIEAEEGEHYYDIDVDLSGFEKSYLYFGTGTSYTFGTEQTPGALLYKVVDYMSFIKESDIEPYNDSTYIFNVDLLYKEYSESEDSLEETMRLSDVFKDKDYVSYGDSITAGAQSDDTGGGTYGMHIANYFGLRHINKGSNGSVPISSSNLSDANLEAVTENTRLVTISGGQNRWVTSDDIDTTDRETSIGAINYYIDQIRIKSPKCVIILCPTYIGNGDTQCAKDYQLIADNKHVGLAPTTDLRLIDWEGDKTVNLLRYDNVHLTGFGAKKFAAVVREYARQFFF